MNHSVNGNGQQIKMYTTTWCPDCWRAKQVLESLQAEFIEINLMHDPDAVATVERLNQGHRSVPTLVFPDGSVLTEPPAPELAAKVKAMTKRDGV